MASGDTVYSASGFTVLRSAEETANGQRWEVSLNKGGTTSTTRADLDLTAHVSSLVNAPFDVTKQYEVIIKEV
jgi:hypothetical protein